jgi:hypothetical protein
VEWICGECGDQQGERATSYCGACQERLHKEECKNCDRVDPEDCGYCPDCDRGDCGACDYHSPGDWQELQDEYDQHDQYEEYLVDKLEAAGIDFLSLSHFLEGEKSERKEEGEPEAPREEPEADEIERRLDEAEKRRKEAQPDV